MSTTKNCEICDNIIHMVKFETPFSYTYRYIPDANKYIIYPLSSISVKVKGPFNEQGVVIRVEKIKHILDKYIIKPWSFSILVNKDQLPVPPNLIGDYKVIPVDFVPSVEGTSTYIYLKIKRKLEKYGVKLVKVDVTAEFDGVFVGTAQRKS